MATKTKAKSTRKAAPKAKAKKPKAKRKAPFKMSTGDAAKVRSLLKEVRGIGAKYRRRGKQMGLGL